MPDTLVHMLDLLDPTLVASILGASDAPRPVPEDNEVVAGYIALFIWLGLCVAVALLGWSLVRQFRKTTAANEAGLYDAPADAPTTAADSSAEREDDTRS